MKRCQIRHRRRERATSARSCLVRPQRLFYCRSLFPRSACRDDAEAALEFRLGERYVGDRLDQPSQAGFVGLEERTAMARRSGRGRRRCPLPARTSFSLIAAEGLTAKRQAASRIELPFSRTIRSRSSPKAITRARGLGEVAGTGPRDRDR